MKSSQLKRLIKESVREVIQEELKEILLEALKSPKQPIYESPQPPINPPFVPGDNPNFTPPSTSLPKQNLREVYSNILEDTQKEMNTNGYSGDFSPTPGMDTVNGQLPGGSVNLSQISALLG